MIYLLVPNAAVIKKCYATSGKKKMRDKREILIIFNNNLVFVTIFFLRILAGFLLGRIRNTVS